MKKRIERRNEGTNERKNEGTKEKIVPNGHGPSLDLAVTQQHFPLTRANGFVLVWGSKTGIASSLLVSGWLGGS
jgi:hypothetical protein